MRLPAPPPHRPAEPIAALTDIEFLLLIFFMLVGVIAPREPFPVEPPAADGATSSGHGKLTILLADDGRLGFEGEELDLPQLSARLRERLTQEGMRDAELELKADAAVNSARILAVFDALRSAGVERLSLLTVSRSNP
jgi:biopolymer transport protein ExbD